MSQPPQDMAGRASASRWVWPFELLEKIGEGGMGVVYRARYVGNNRIVAVKLLPADVADNPSLVARFDRELEILKQLRHPHIVHCFGGVCESQQRFYAMELVEGGTLADLLREHGRLSWEHVVEYGLQMCSALQHAHEHGVVHRDVKPGNFLVGKGGQLKLSDFGLATMASASRITRAGKTAGTYLYMAPEQIRGEPPVTAQTDLYSLGCVLYELLTGHPPFDGEAPAVILHKHLKETAPRVSSLVWGCPEALDQLVADLLQKQPELRPESAAAAEMRLRSVVRPSIVHVDALARTPQAPFPTVPSASDDSVATGPAKRALWSLVPWIALVCLLSIIAGLGWWRALLLSGQLQRLEASWVEAARHSSDHRAREAALEQLLRAEMLSLPTIEEVAALLNDGDPRIRIASLKVLERQSSGARSHLAEVVRIHQRDDDPQVRHQAELTSRAIRDTPASMGRAVWWVALAVALVGLLLVGWGWSHRVWERSDRPG